MKKNDEVFIYYYSGLMDSDEKIKFENEISRSEELKREYELFLSKIENLNPGDMELDSRYFINMIPRFRERLDTKKKKFSLRRIVYLAPTLAAVVLVFFIITNNSDNKVKLDEAVKEVVNNMNDTEAVQKYFTEIDTHPSEYASLEETNNLDVQIPAEEVSLDALKSVYEKVSQIEYPSLSDLSNGELELIASNLNTIKIK